MAGKESPEASPDGAPDAVPYRCPNCGGPLEALKNQPERLCQKCGIFVEFLEPLTSPHASPEREPGDVPRRLGQAKVYLAYQDLEEAGGRADGSASDRVAPREGPAPPSPDSSPAQQPVAPIEPPTAPSAAPPPEVLPPRPEGPKALPPGEAAPPALPAAEEVATGPPAIAPEPVPSPIAEPTPPPESEELAVSTEPAIPGPPPAAAPTEPPAPSTGRAAVRPRLVRWQILKSTRATLAEIAVAYGLDPTGTKAQLRERLLAELERQGTPAEAVRESAAGNRPQPPFGADAAPETDAGARAEEPAAGPEADTSPVIEIAEEPVPEEPVPPADVEYVEEEPPPPEAEPEAAVETRASATAEARTVTETAPKPSRADRATFYIGAAQVAFGGSLLILGSFLHDVFRVPLFGDAYGAFGILNVTAVVFGALFLATGVGAMAVGALRGTRRRAPRGAGG